MANIMEDTDFETKSLIAGIEEANKRCDVAWDNYDEDGYDGAVNTGNRLFLRLKEHNPAAAERYALSINALN